jgi:hypothetical protein
MRHEAMKDKLLDMLAQAAIVAALLVAALEYFDILTK